MAITDFLICFQQPAYTRLTPIRQFMVHQIGSLVFVHPVHCVPIRHNLDLDAGKPDFDACEQQRRRPACASVQSNQCLCYSLSGKYTSPTSSLQTFNILASMCS